MLLKSLPFFNKKNKLKEAYDIANSLSFSLCNNAW